MFDEDPALRKVDEKMHPGWVGTYDLRLEQHKLCPLMAMSF